MKILKVITLILLLATALQASELNIAMSNFQKNFPGTKWTKFKESEVKGLYEIYAGKNILYTDGQVLIFGHIFSPAGKDLTQIKLLESNLDLSIALKIGNGSKKVIEITDPECPFCKVAEDYFHNANVTRYIYFMPLPMHKKAPALSEHILCSKDPEKEYHNIMKGNFPKQLLQCESGQKQLENMMAQSSSLGVQGTPVFFIDGQKITGADPKIKNLIQK